MTLNHQIDGNLGPRLLLLHPIGLDLTFFDPLVDRLCDRARILRADMRGHGRTPPRPGPADLGTYADDVHALLTGISWLPATVIGFSFGGMLAQVLGLTHPADARALVIGACTSTMADEGRLAAIARGEKARRDGMASIVEPTMERWFSAGFRASARAEAVRHRLLTNDVATWVTTWRAIAGINTLTALPAIRVPALCLAGELNQSAPPPAVRTIADAIPDSTFQMIAQAPHMCFIERPDEVASAIQTFLDELRAREERVPPDGVSRSDT